MPPKPPPKKRTSDPKPPAGGARASRGSAAGSAASPSGAARKTSGPRRPSGGKAAQSPAEKALAEVKEKDLAELASFAKPPPLMAATMGCVAAVLQQGKKDDAESFIKGKLKNAAAFIKELRAVDIGQLPGAVVQIVHEFCANEKHAPAELAKVSRLGAALGAWLHAIELMRSSAGAAPAGGPTGSTGMPTEPIPRAEANALVKGLAKEDWTSFAALEEPPEPARVAAVTAAAVLKELRTKDSWNGAQYWFQGAPQYAKDEPDDFAGDIDIAASKIIGTEREGFVTQFAEVHGAALPEFERTGLRCAHAIALWLLAIAAEVREAGAAAAAKQAEFKAKTDAMQKDHKCTPLHLKQLKAVLEQTWAEGKVPLVVHDKTDRAATFLQYNSLTVEARKIVVQHFVQKKPIEEVREELRQQLVGCLRHGRWLHIAMDNTACNFNQLYDPATLPSFFWKHPEMIKEENYKPVLRDADKNDFGPGGSAQLDGYGVVTTSKFAFDEYREYLAEALPLDDFEVFAVYTDDEPLF